MIYIYKLITSIYIFAKFDFGWFVHRSSITIFFVVWIWICLQLYIGKYLVLKDARFKLEYTFPDLFVTRIKFNWVKAWGIEGRKSKEMDRNNRRRIITFNRSLLKQLAKQPVCFTSNSINFSLSTQPSLASDNDNYSIYYNITYVILTRFSFLIFL